MRSPCPADRERGTVTAEFAVALPALLLVLAACLGALRLGAEQVRVVDAAALAARSAARGDDPAFSARLAQSAGADGIATSRTAGGLVCVVARRVTPVLGLALPLAARSCALGTVP
jgi:Flp pilus assembly protein TadG